MHGELIRTCSAGGLIVGKENKSIVPLPCKDFVGVTTTSALSHMSIHTLIFMMAVKELTFM